MCSDMIEAPSSYLLAKKNVGLSLFYFVFIQKSCRRGCFEKCRITNWEKLDKNAENVVHGELLIVRCGAAGLRCFFNYVWKKIHENQEEIKKNAENVVNGVLLSMPFTAKKNKIERYIV